ncbi:MAG: glycosyltransferase family 39 protein [Gemmatimonadaceae bacterium]
MIWITWGSFAPRPIVEDEVSYVLQSRIFASGHWTAPSPPLPEFFQQGQMLTIPAVASKYPPGHALLLSLGALVGAPALVPLLLTGLTGALVFGLVRRVANPPVALLAWLIWLSDPIELQLRPGYFSEVSSSAMWMLALWALLNWRDNRRTRWLLALAAAIGWGAVTRPLTMLAFAVPVGVVVIRDIARTRSWRELGLAVGLGAALLAIIPLWSAMTTGDWRLSPQTRYTRDYLPYDKPGFGVDSTPPALALSPVDRFTYIGFFNEHVRHTPANLPSIAFERLSAIAHDEWSGPRLVLVPFVVLGLFAMTAPVWFGLACSVALFGGYLSYGHWAHWTIYCLEGIPVLSVIAALGVWKALRWIRPRADVRARDLVRLGGTVRSLVMTLAILVILAGYECLRWRETHRRNALWGTAFQELLGKMPVRSAVIFVHYAPRLGPHLNVVANSPHLFAESTWIVNDLGPRNAELLRYAGKRVPLAFFERDMHIEVDRQLVATARDSTAYRPISPELR